MLLVKLDPYMLSLFCASSLLLCRGGDNFHSELWNAAFLTLLDVQGHVIRSLLLGAAHFCLFIFRECFFYAELDELEVERRRDECLDDMNELEQQFAELKEQCVYII